MTWINSNASWPASSQAIHNNADTVLSQVNGVMSSALAKVASTDAKVSYTRHPLSSEAEALLNLRTELNNLQVTAKTLTVTPNVFGLGTEGYLSARAAINALVAKLTDKADRHTPANQSNALVLLISAASPGQLLNQLTPLCNLLNVPALRAYQRHLQRSITLESDKMQQNTAALAPRWTKAQQLNLQPLRNAASLLGGELAQLESLSHDAATPLAKLTALANKRTAMLAELKSSLEALAAVSTSVWRLSFSGSARALAAELNNTDLPINQPVSVAMVISSPQPLTFFQELFE